MTAGCGAPAPAPEHLRSCPDAPEASSLLPGLSLRLSLAPAPLLGSARQRCPPRLPRSALYSSWQAWGARFRDGGGGSGRREAGLKQAAAGATGWGGGALLLPPWLPTSSCDVEQEREGAEEGGEKKAAEGAGWRDLCRARQGVQGPRIPIVFYWEEG